MKKMQGRIAWLCQKAEAAEKLGAETVFCSRVAQITFNAWHYVDANLWASIACRIFEGLDYFISEHSENPEAKQAQLFRRLETAKEKLEEAKTATKAAKQEVSTTEKQLEQLEQQRREKTLRLEDVRNAAIEKALTDNAEIREKLEDWPGCFPLGFRQPVQGHRHPLGFREARVAQGGHNIGIPGQNPKTHRLIPMHGIRRPNLLVEKIRISANFGTKQVGKAE
jgi:hypothetical protein